MQILFIEAIQTRIINGFCINTYFMCDQSKQMKRVFVNSPKAVIKQTTTIVQLNSMRDFRLSSRCRWDLRSSGVLGSLEW
jgi:hypothetical protein